MAKTKKTAREGARALGYIRVSTMDQADEGVSLSAQRRLIEDYCRFRELDLVDVIEDPAVSAKKPLSDREGGARLLALLRDERNAHIIGLKIDRLFRDVVDCLNTITSWDQEGVALHLIDMGGQTVDTGSAAGRLLITLLAAVAEWERRIISERTRMGMAETRAQGQPVGKAPYGKRWVTFEDDRKGYLEDDPAEVRVIELIQHMRAEGLGYRKIASHLNAEGIPARGKSWHATSVVRIVKRAEENNVG